MLSNIKKYECKIQTLTPIHIGSGNKYGPSEFIFHKGKFRNSKNREANEIITKNIIRRVNFDNYYDNLSEEKQEKFLEKITNSNFNLNNFDKDNPKKFKRYDSFIDNPNPLPNEIIEHIRTMDELYIPGSSVKGAIKTAILYNEVEKGDFESINSLLKEKYGRTQLNRKKYPNFENRFFSSRDRGQAAQYNISKFLQVFDSNSMKTGKIQKVITIKATQNGRDGNGFKNYQRNGSTVVSHYETIPNKKVFTSGISINYDSNIFKPLNLESKSHLIDIDNIKEFIYNFSNDFIFHELNFYEKYGDEKLEKHYEQLNKINKVDEPLIKIGQGSGFLSTTIGLKIKELGSKLDSNLYEKIRKVARRSYPYEYPKSRKIISGSRMPLGWVKLKINELD